MDACNFWQGNIETEYFTTEQIEEIQVYNVINKDFVNNLDMQNQNWERALINFEYVIEAKHNNPFAYYYASKAAKELGMDDKAESYYKTYLSIRSNNEEWEKVFEKFMDESGTFSNI